MSDTIELPVQATDLLTQLRDQIDRTAITPEVLKFYAHRYEDVKNKIDELAAETQLRQDKMRFLNELICDINNLTNEKQELDFTQNLEMQEKLRVAKALGANIDDAKFNFNPVERDRLIQNLHVKAEEWNETNRQQTQQMERHAKHLDQILIMMKEFQKGEDRAKRNATTGIKGG